MMKGFICKKTMHVIRAVVVIELHFAVGKKQLLQLGWFHHEQDPTRNSQPKAEHHFLGRYFHGFS